MGAVDKAIEQIKSDLESGESYVDYVVATRVENGHSGTERGALVVTSKRLIYQGTALFGGGTRVEWRLKSLNRRPLASDQNTSNQDASNMPWLVNR